MKEKDKKSKKHEPAPSPKPKKSVSKEESLSNLSAALLMEKDTIRKKHIQDIIDRIKGL